MPANKILGSCKCPLPWCGKLDAEVREGEKGTPYIICEHCVSMIRSSSRAGRDGMRAMITKPAAAPVVPPKEEKKEPAKSVAEKPAAKRGTFF